VIVGARQRRLGRSGGEEKHGVSVFSRNARVCASGRYGRTRYLRCHVGKALPSFMLQVNDAHSHLEIIMRRGKIGKGDRGDGVKNMDGEVGFKVGGG